jgi:hypothetical protein
MGDSYGQEIYNEMYTIRYRMDDVIGRIDTIESYISKLDSLEHILNNIYNEISGLRRDMREIAGGRSSVMKDVKDIL